MTSTIMAIFYFIIKKLMSLGFFSFIVNSFLLILNEKQVFGSKSKVNTILYKIFFIWFE